MSLIKPSFSTGYAKNASESANPNLWKGLVGAWMPSFGVTGGTLKDVSGNGNDGTLTNMDAASDWVATSKGLALDFDGVDDYVAIGQIPTLGTSPSGTTIVATLKRKWFNSNDFIFDGSTSASFGNGVSLRFKSDNKIRFWNYNANYFVDSTITVIDSAYHQIVGRHHSGENSIFFDGNKVASSNGDSSTSNNGTFRIGSSQVLANPSAITVHSVFAYNRALSPAEIKQLYLNPSAPFERKKQTVVRIATPAPAATTKTISVKKPKPSFATGYARNASESANPNLWKGLVGAWMPSFGVTGGSVKELTSKSPDLTLENIPYSNWEAKNKSLAVMLEGNDDYLNGTYCDAVNFGYKNFTVTNHFYVTAYAAIEALFEGRSTSPYYGFHTYMRNSDRVQVQLRSSGSLDQYLFTFTAVGGQLATDKIHAMSTVVDREKAICTGYVNGVYIGNAAISSSMTDINSNTDFRFGRNIANQYPLTGGVTSLFIHHRALNQREVRTLHANPSAPFERKAQNLAVPAAQVTPSGVFNPFSVLSHPLEQ